jgi:hypothetical protein
MYGKNFQGKGANTFFYVFLLARKAEKELPTNTKQTKHQA